MLSLQDGRQPWKTMTLRAHNKLVTYSVNCSAYISGGAQK